MLFLLFQVGNDRYALEASHVVEVVPLLSLKTIPAAPKGVAGLFNYRGRPVPVVDLCQLTRNQPAHERLSTRIIIVHHPDSLGQNHLLGLIAEQATTTVRKEAGDFTDASVRLGNAPYLGPVIMDGPGVIQWIHERHLLPEPVRDILFSDTHSVNHDPP
jgi:chemotaxis-related protein WspB